MIVSILIVFIVIWLLTDLRKSSLHPNFLRVLNIDQWITFDEI